MIVRFILLSMLTMSFVTIAEAQSSVIFFDNSGAETGVTPLGTTDFSFEGSNWTGGEVMSVGVLALYASPPASYIPAPGVIAAVTFDQPVLSVDFFFVHGMMFGPGTATAFDSSDGVVDTVTSNMMTSLGDAANFEILTGSEPIVRVEFSGGVIDNFNYAFAPSPDSDFDRSDCNADGARDVADAVFLLSNVLFPMGSPTTPDCADACDANDDGGTDIGDAVSILTALFSGGSIPEPTTCGPDPTDDLLDCATYDSCP